MSRKCCDDLDQIDWLRSNQLKYILFYCYLLAIGPNGGHIASKEGPALLTNIYGYGLDIPADIRK